MKIVYFLSFFWHRPHQGNSVRQRYHHDKVCTLLIISKNSIHLHQFFDVLDGKKCPFSNCPVFGAIWVGPRFVWPAHTGHTIREKTTKFSQTKKNKINQRLNESEEKTLYFSRK